MIYKTTSIKKVIQQVISNTKDTGFIPDIHEWCVQAMDMMQTKFQLLPTFKDVDVNFHRAEYPCGLQVLVGIEYNGSRMPLKQSDISLTSKCAPGGAASSQEMFLSIPTEQEVLANEPHKQYHTTMIPLENLPWGAHWYQNLPGMIETSLKSGKIRMHYLTVPTDQEGWPLIPDNQDYRTAIYWYCRSMMIGAGYQDPVFRFQDCYQLWEKHAATAIEQVTYPSPERMDMLIDRLVRFIPPANYYESFGFVANGEKMMYPPYH